MSMEFSAFGGDFRETKNVGAVLRVTAAPPVKSTLSCCQRPVVNNENKKQPPHQRKRWQWANLMTFCALRFSITGSEKGITDGWADGANKEQKSPLLLLFVVIFESWITSSEKRIFWCELVRLTFRQTNHQLVSAKTSKDKYQSACQTRGGHISAKKHGRYSSPRRVKKNKKKECFVLTNIAVVFISTACTNGLFCINSKTHGCCVHLHGVYKKTGKSPSVVLPTTPRPALQPQLPKTKTRHKKKDHRVLEDFRKNNEFV